MIRDPERSPRPALQCPRPRDLPLPAVANVDYRGPKGNMKNTQDTPAWRRSRSCESSSCVEAAVIGDDVVVRDSKAPDGPILRFNRAEWDAFVTGVQHGEFGFESLQTS
jgi:Domain of unknown function (DUF397)